MSNNDLLFTKTLKVREIQRGKKKKHDILWCLFLEVNGNLAPLAFKAGNERPTLTGEAAFTFFPQSSTRTRRIAAKQCRPWDVSLHVAAFLTFPHCLTARKEEDKGTE